MHRSIFKRTTALAIRDKTVTLWELPIIPEIRLMQLELMKIRGLRKTDISTRTTPDRLRLRRIIQPSMCHLPLTLLALGVMRTTKARVRFKMISLKLLQRTSSKAWHLEERIESDFHQEAASRGFDQQAGYSNEEQSEGFEGQQPPQDSFGTEKQGKGHSEGKWK